MPIYEIVNVLDGRYLLDAESYQRSYVTQSGRTLLPGFYLVMWTSSDATEFDESAEYIGPFKLALHAKLKLAQYLDESQARTPPPPRVSSVEQRAQRA